MEAASQELTHHPVGGSEAVEAEMHTVIGYLAIESDLLQDNSIKKDKRERQAIFDRCDSHLYYYSALREAL